MLGRQSVTSLRAIVVVPHHRGPHGRSVTHDSPRQVCRCLLTLGRTGWASPRLRRARHSTAPRGIKALHLCPARSATGRAEGRRPQNLNLLTGLERQIAVPRMRPNYDDSRRSSTKACGCRCQLSTRCSGHAGLGRRCGWRARRAARSSGFAGVSAARQCSCGRAHGTPIRFRTDGLWPICRAGVLWTCPRTQCHKRCCG